MRFPRTEAKKFRYAAFKSASACCSATDDTSVSQARSGLAFAAVSRADITASLMYGSPAAQASCRARSASLNTTRAHPNTLASACICPGDGYSRYRYLSCTYQAWSVPLTIGTDSYCASGPLTRAVTSSMNHGRYPASG